MCRHFRSLGGYLWMCEVSRFGDRLCRRSLHYCCLLVHRVYLFCESSRDSCPLRKQHVCWHSANGRSAIHVGAAVRGFRSDGIVPMAAYSASSASCTVVMTVFRESISS